MTVRLKVTAVVWAQGENWVIESISHITFIVRNLERTSILLREVFDASEIYDSGSQPFSLSREKFFLIGGVWIAIMEGEPLAERSYQHVAFKVAPSRFDDYVRRVVGLGLEIRPGRSRVEGEALSLYFYDYDNHLFELHTGSLSDRLARYQRE